MVVLRAVQILDDEFPSARLISKSVHLYKGIFPVPLTHYNILRLTRFWHSLQFYDLSEYLEIEHKNIEAPTSSVRSFTMQRGCGFLAPSSKPLDFSE